jgi:hypothetical protein
MRPICPRLECVALELGKRGIRRPCGNVHVASLASVMRPWVMPDVDGVTFRRHVDGGSGLSWPGRLERERQRPQPVSPVGEAMGRELEIAVVRARSSRRVGR